MSVRKRIRTYLDALARAMAGLDKALVQDALSDAEEHLMAAVEAAMPGGEADALERAIADFGEPAAIAAAWAQNGGEPPQERKAMTQRRPGLLARFFGIIIDPRAWTSLIYLLLAGATGVVYFVIAVTGVSLTAGLMILIIGPIVGLAFLFLVRAVAWAEGRLVEGLLGETMPRRPRYLSRAWTWARARETVGDAIRDPQTWGSLLYMVLQFGLGLVYFVVLVTLSAVAAAFTAGPAAFLADRFGVADIDWSGTQLELWPGVNAFDQWMAEPWMTLPYMIAGVLLIFVILNLARGLGALHGRIAKALLVRSRGAIAA